MDQAELDRLRALCERATDGEWELRKVRNNNEIWQAEKWIGDMWTAGDAAFVVMARTALPALLDAYERAIRQRDHARTIADAIHSRYEADYILHSTIRERHTGLLSQSLMGDDDDGWPA